jgi:DNA-binding GntR family transcriptional regulator
MARPLRASKGQERAAMPLADFAYETIENRIVNRELPPGALISENQLSDELGMGRTPIREALQRLKHIGFVEIHPRRGVLVLGVDITHQLELLEVRRPLEELMVMCAAQRATASERSELDGLAQELTKAAKSGQRTRYFHANREIHETEVRAAHNQVLSTTMNIIHAHSRRFWYAYVEQTNGYDEGARHHSAVIAAIVRGDAELAARNARQLTDFLEKLTRNILEKRVILHDRDRPPPSSMTAAPKRSREK